MVLKGYGKIGRLVMKKMTGGILGLTADESLMRWGAFSVSGAKKFRLLASIVLLEREAAFFGVGGHEYPLDGY